MEMTDGVMSDLAELDDLTEETILAGIKERYDRDLIYTSIKDILIAVNPNKPLRSLYDKQAHADYNYTIFNADLQPHVFQTVATAYRRMRESETNQVVIVSGESGSGKTESTKHMVTHVVNMCQEGNMELHKKIIEVNPLLESFGNAKTIMNLNSSRFAKYLELSFKDKGEIAGAVVRDYMLEKSRVVHQSQGEGIFHIFYALFAGCPKDLREDLFLTGQTGEYRIMQSDHERLDQDDFYRKMYTENMAILKKIRVDTDILHAMLAAVILITEIDFHENDKTGVAEISDAAPYIHAAILLELDETEFGHALIAFKKKFKDNDIVTFKNVKQAKDGRDALAKILYERMFGWLVRQINAELHPNRLGTNIFASIGILDIAGFEKLRDNSFEQMCINLVNEKLQNFMNKRIFTIEMEIYMSEGIEIEGINFTTNDDTLDLFERKKTGILAILDEQSNLQISSDLSFVQCLKTTVGTAQQFNEVKGDRPAFFIQHFAAQVMYNAEGFIEKNRDRLNDELMLTMMHSKDEFISDLFTVKRGPTGTISSAQQQIRASHRGVKLMPHGKAKLKPTPQGDKLAAELGKSLKRKFGTVGKPQEGITLVTNTTHNTLVSYFRASLLDLLEKLNQAEPFYVRCLKPNADQQPNAFNDTMVKDQLKYNGIAQVALIRKMGYAVRKMYTDFLKRYKGVVTTMQQSESNLEFTRKILLTMPPVYHNAFRCGKTRVFMTNDVENWLGLYLQVREKAADSMIKKNIKLWALKKSEQIKERKREEERKRQEEIRRREEERRQQEEETRRENERLRANGLNTSQRISPTEDIDHTDPKVYDFAKPVPELPVMMRNPTSQYQPSPGTSSSSSQASSTSENQYAGSVRKPPSPPSVVDGDYDRADSVKREDTKKDDAKENKKKTSAFWDVCRVIARERRAKDVHEERSLQVIKALTYFLLFCILLFCAVSQKISLMVLASSQYDRTGNRTYDERDEDAVIAAGRHFLMTLAILIPYGLIFLVSTFKWMFGGFTVPQKKTLILCFVIEFLHTVGICILCFLILPELDMARGIMLLSAVGIVPSLLIPICSSQPRSKYKPGSSPRTKRMLIFIGNLASILGQIGYIPLILLSDHFLDESSTDNQTTEIALVVISLILISFSWWENFIDDRFCGVIKRNSAWHEFIMSIKFDLQEARPVVSFFMSLWKICWTILLSYMFKEYLPINNDLTQRNIDDISMYEAVSKLNDMPIKMNTAILTLVLAAYAGHYVGQTACKLKLQKVSYNIPLILSTPVAVIIVALDCSDGLNVLGTFTDERRACPDADSVLYNWYHYITGIVVLMTVYWIGRHIFYPNIERLAKAERLFLNPFYCGITFEQHLVLNRRRHNRKITKEFKEDKIYYKLSVYDTTINIEGDAVEDDKKSENGRETEADIDDESYTNPKFRDIPMIYACATMWHENKQELMQIMKSLFRMDRDQYLRKISEAISGKEDKEFYDFEAHIMFDDAMEMNDDDEWVPNQFVKLMMSVMNDAASSTYEKHMTLRPPFKVPTPYGGQLIFTLPGENFLFIHMKDKQKIRHRKRWSQVMYMYYLLGFRIVRMCQETVTAALNENKIHELMNWEETREVGRSHVFQAFDEQVLRKANNTYLLALDGDVDFTPGAVRLLLDRMRKSEKVGAACGRIHPIGSGPIVWFQKFEYAIAHWLQKATEHVLGCVLCSPGCFSLFRGSALMDDNVMKKYTVLPTEASHHLMYDQGEDRWLCTLLLQQGYRVDYAAGSDAFTYAPEGFGEFFNQRRRWMPSTVANIIDLLADYRNTVYANSNISMLYIFYQASLLLSTIIGPATVLMMIAGANVVVFRTNLWESYLISLAPAIFYFAICFAVETKWQILIAEILTGFYAFIMMIVLVGTIVTAAQNSPFHPSVIFIAFLVFIFMFAAMLHPKEWTCVIFGALYFLLIPTGFLLLIFYSLCNMHNVSWGTREVPKRKTAAEKIEEEAAKKIKEEEKKKKKERGFFGRFLPQSPLKDLKELLGNLTDITGTKKVSDDSETTNLLRNISQGINKLVDQKGGHVAIDIDDHDTKDSTKKSVAQKEGQLHSILKKSTKEVVGKRKSVEISESVKIVNDDSDEPIYDKIKKKKRDDLVNPAWAECEELGDGKVLPMVGEELKFWEGFLEKYLKPLELSNDEKKKISNGLIELRNNVCLGMAMINLLWIAINFMFQLSSPTKISVKLGGGSDNVEDNLEENQESTLNADTTDNLVKVDVLGMLFIFFFLIILLLQFAGMILHRWGTFLHLVSVTQLKNPFASKKEYDMEGQGIDVKAARDMVEVMLSEPMPDYPSDSDDDSGDEDDAKQELENLQKTGTRFRQSVNNTGNLLAASSRQLGRSTRQLNNATINALSRSTKIISNTLKAANGRNMSAPERGEQLAKMQDEYRKRKDSKYKDRALPPIKKSNLNLMAGKSDLEELLQGRNLLETRDDRRRPLVEENEDDDNIYDIIPKKGTIGRQLGKKMRMHTRAAVSFNVSNGDAPATQMRYRDTGRPNRGNRGNSANMEY